MFAIDRSRGVWVGFAEKMFMFCAVKSTKILFLAKTIVILLSVGLFGDNKRA